MQRVFQKVLELSMTGSVIALAVMVIRLLFRNAPKWTMCLLWGLVALRLVCPVNIESGFSLMPQRIATGQIISNMADTPLPDEQGLSTPEGVTQTIPVDGDFFHEDVVSREPSVTVGGRFFSGLGWIWLAGMMGMLGYAVISYLSLKHKMAEATRLRENIWQSEQAEMPFVLGFLRPRIYLPYHITEEDIPPVIAHEQAHIRRKDHWWKPLGFLLLSVHWFNPVLWAAYCLLCRDIESACDEKVIRSMEKREKQAYSTALLHCSIRRRAITACPLAFGEVGVKERVKHVMRFKKPGFWMMLIALLVCAVVAVCFLTNPTQAPKAPEPFAHSYRVSQILYQDGRYSFAYTTRTAPRYSLTSDYQLFTIEDPDSGVWNQLPGAFREVKLSGLIFDDYFKGDDPSSPWGTPQDGAESIREQTAQAWRFDVEGDTNGVFYYLILTETDRVYLCYGYDVGDLHAEAEPGSLIRWVFQLERTDLLTCSAVSGNCEAHIEPVYYPMGYDWDYEGIAEGAINDSGTLFFYPEWNPEALSVREEYHRKTGDSTEIQSAAYQIPRGPDGTYEMPVSRRGATREEAVYFVECDTGVYIFRIVYNNSSAPLTEMESTLTLEKLVDLSQKGDEMTWEDFRDYPHEDVGSGLYIFRFTIDDNFCLDITGGDSRMEDPMGFYLRSLDGSDAYIDIREGDVAAFIRNHSGEKKVSMVPTDSGNTGIFDRYLYLTIDGEKYRFERQEIMPVGIQAGPLMETVYEDDGLGNRYAYSVYFVKNVTDNSMFLVHSEDMDMMWLYRYSPAKAVAPDSLQQAKDSGYVVLEDGDPTWGQELWQDFYDKTQQGIPAAVTVAHYHTLDPERCSTQYYEAYREDYPSLYLYELSFDGETYRVQTGDMDRKYEYLMRYPDTLTGKTEYVLTHDNRVTWDALFQSLVSSQLDAYIDHCTVYRDVE